MLNNIMLSIPPAHIESAETTIDMLYEIVINVVILILTRCVYAQMCNLNSLEGDEKCVTSFYFSYSSLSCTIF